MTRDEIEARCDEFRRLIDKRSRQLGWIKNVEALEAALRDLEDKLAS